MNVVYCGRLSFAKVRPFSRAAGHRYTGTKAPRMNTYLKFGTLMVLIVGSLVWLAFSGVKDTKTYYKTIPELQRMGSQAQGQRLRVGGDVLPGSILKNGSRVSFELHQGAETLKVVYTGTDPLPDTFKDNAQALAEGRLGLTGVFEANHIQAKCASKYEAKPAQRVTHEPASARS
jgi:cytochrome c-type biogenesis protein CcmE